MHPIFSWLGNGDVEKFSKAFPNAIKENTARFRNRNDFSAINAAGQCFYTKLYLFSNMGIDFRKELDRWLGSNVKLIQLTNRSQNAWNSVISEKICGLTNGFKIEHGIILDGNFLKDGIQHNNACVYTLDNLRVITCNTANSALKPQGFEQFIALSPHSIAPIKRAAQAAALQHSVLITGERGTGKALMAESMAGGKPLTKIDFLIASQSDFEEYLSENSINDTLTEQDKLTLFLEDVDRYSLAAQVLLLKFLIRHKPKTIASAIHNLQAMVNEDRFLPELFYLLAEITVETVPLRDRRGDIPLIAHNFIQQLNETNSMFKSLSPKSMKALQAYSWPGNIDELKRVLTQAYVFSSGDIIEYNDMPFVTVRKKNISQHTNEPLMPGFNLNHVIEDIQKDYIERALNQANGKKAVAAGLLGLNSYQALDVKMKSLKMVVNPSSFR